MGKKLSVKTELSTLWVVVMINMIFADIFTIIIELVNKNTFGGMHNVTTAMGIAAIATNVPILMIYFSRKLPYKVNRWANILAAVFTILYVTIGGMPSLHYIIMAGIEVIFLVVIIARAWKWDGPGANNIARSAQKL
ncbi:MAG: DUF6326 family protein [Tannerellaceae bacterium]|jgi:hypothetical protein|nr:DUF6326 family protein [Tannerellaceae bacterium]